MVLLRRTRREFLRHTAVVGGSLAIGGYAAGAAKAQTPGRLHVASNQYTWCMYFARQNRNFNASLDAGLEEVARSGMDGFEPIINSPEQIDKLAPLLKKHGLQMRSLYVDSALHEPEQAEKSIQTILAIAAKAKDAGTKIVVTNPAPLEGGAAKNDAQLKTQAAALDRLGAALKEMGLMLALHNHAVELQNAAREFHHMMLATDPSHVSLCLDAHWMFRGSGNSVVALFDIIKMYGTRVSELHLRQSAGGVWTEWCGDGDIDYATVAKSLADLGVKPHLVMEQAPENGTPNTIDGVESHRRSRAAVERWFVQ